MANIQLTITTGLDLTAGRLYGLKINEDTLAIKNVKIEDIPELLGITELFVIGYDTQLSKTQQAHYHLHWYDTRLLPAVQKAKQRAMPNWGHTTKLYPAKIKNEEEADPYAWFGYACKEKIYFKSPDIDLQKLEMHAHTQYEFKKSQIKYVEQKKEKVESKNTFEDELFTFLDDHPVGLKRFTEVATAITRYIFQTHGKWITKTPLEMHTWKWCVSRGHFTFEMYTAHLLGHQYYDDQYVFDTYLGKTK